MKEFVKVQDITKTYKMGEVEIHLHPLEGLSQLVRQFRCRKSEGLLRPAIAAAVDIFDRLVDGLSP